MDFFDVLLEAKKSKSTKTPSKKTIKVDSPSNKTTDYSDDVKIDNKDDSKDDDSNNKDNDVTDYTDDENNKDDNTTDYTSEDVQKDPTDNPDDSTDTTDENTDDNIDGTNDYTDENMDDNTDDSSDDTDNSDSTDESSDDDNNEKIKNNSLLKDYLDLYYLTKNTITKLSNLDKSDIILNKVSTQVISNLNKIQNQIFSFILYKFSKNNYINNLYQYNYFIEAFRINIEMVKKISFFVTNKQNKYIKNQ